MSLSEKRAICDTLMRLRRTREGLEIVGQEIRRLLSASSDVVDMLMHSLAVVEDQLSRPEDARLPVVEPMISTGRYCIQQKSTAVLRGLRAVIQEAINIRRQYLASAQSRLVPHMRE